MKSLQTVCLLLATAGLVAAQQYTISSIAGIPGVAGLYPLPGDVTPTPATNGHLYHPSTVAVDSKGNFYIADSYTYSIRMVTASTGNISTIAGNGAPGSAGDNDTATSANIFDVHGIAIDTSGNVYISDTSTCRIRRIDNPATNTTPKIATFAGSSTGPFCGATATSPFSSPGALAFDSKGNLYVADYASSTVRMITSAGAVSTFAGTGTYGNSGDGGAASKAALAYPVSLAFDTAGNLYVGDEGNSNIRRIDTGGNITTVTTGVNPLGMGVDASGNFYFVDGVSSSVRKVLPGGGVVTIAGNGMPGFSGDGGPGFLASLFQPTGLAVGSDGSIYVADTGNDVIRRLAVVPSSIGFQDAASELPGSNLRGGSISPGEILTLFGSGLGPATLTQFTIANGLFPTQIAGTSVTFNGTPAPMIYTSTGLVAVIAPYEISGSATAAVALTYQGKTFNVSMPVMPTTPAVFTANASGTGQAAAINVADGSFNNAAHPAKVGSFIELYATGAGFTSGAVDGQPTPLSCGGACTAQLPVAVKIGNQCVNPTYAGGAPSLVAGVMQVNVQIPATIIPGAVQVQVLVGGNCQNLTGYPSQSGVTVAVTQ